MLNHSQQPTPIAQSSSSTNMCLGISSKFFQTFLQPKLNKEPLKLTAQNNEVNVPAMTKQSKIKILKPLVANHKPSSSKQLVLDKLQIDDDYYISQKETDDSQKTSQRENVISSSRTATMINSQNRQSIEQNVNKEDAAYYINNSTNLNHYQHIITPKIAVNTRYSISKHNRVQSQCANSNILDQVDKNQQSKHEVNSIYSKNDTSDQDSQNQISEKDLVSEGCGGNDQYSKRDKFLKIIKPNLVNKKNYDQMVSRSSTNLDKIINSTKNSLSKILNSETVYAESDITSSNTEWTDKNFLMKPVYKRGLHKQKLSVSNSQVLQELSIHQHNSSNMASGAPITCSTRINTEQTQRFSVESLQQTRQSIKFDYELKQQHEQHVNLLEKIGKIGRAPDRKSEDALNYYNIANESVPSSISSKIQSFQRRKASEYSTVMSNRVLQTETNNESQDTYYAKFQNEAATRKSSISKKIVLKDTTGNYMNRVISSSRSVISSKKVENGTVSKNYSIKSNNSYNNQSVGQTSNNSEVSDFGLPSSKNNFNSNEYYQKSHTTQEDARISTKKAHNYYQNHIIQSHHQQQQQVHSRNKRDSSTIQETADQRNQVQEQLIQLLQGQKDNISKIINKISLKTKAELSLTQAEKDIRSLSKVFKNFLAHIVDNILEGQLELVKQHVRTHYLVFGFIRIFREDLKTDDVLSQNILNTLRYIKKNYGQFIEIIHRQENNNEHNDHLLKKNKNKKSFDFDKISSIPRTKTAIISSFDSNQSETNSSPNDNIGKIKHNTQLALSFLKKICRQAQSNQDKYKLLLKIISQIESNTQSEQHPKIKHQIKKVLRALKSEISSDTPKSQPPVEQKRKRNIFSTVESVITPKSQNQKYPQIEQPQLARHHTDGHIPRSKNIALSQNDKENFNPNTYYQQKIVPASVQNKLKRNNLSDTALTVQHQNNMGSKKQSNKDVSNVSEYTTNSKMFQQQQTQYNQTQLNGGVKKINVIRSNSVPQKDIRLPSRLPLHLKYTLVLDLDETLVHFDTAIRSYRIRPYARKFIEEMSKYYELVVFTAGLKEYADWILDDFDKDGYISHRLYRDSTNYKNGVHIKDLSRLGRDLAKIIIIDNIEDNFQAQPNNGIPIKGWYVDPADRELEKLIEPLKYIVKMHSQDVRPEIIKYKQQLYEEQQKLMAETGRNRLKNDYVKVR